MHSKRPGVVHTWLWRLCRSRPLCRLLGVRVPCFVYSRRVTRDQLSVRVEGTRLTSASPHRKSATNARRQGLTSPTEGHPPAVPQRINTAVAAPDATVPTVAREWPYAVKPHESFLCLNPRCPDAVRITRSGSKGRPQLFCSAKCRRAYDYERGQLLLDKERLDEAMARPGGTFREREVVKAALASIERCLLHYTYSATAAPSEG